MIDTKDSKNKLEITLYVEIIKSLRSFEERKEVPFNNEGDIIVVGEGGHGRQFTLCDSLEVGLDTTMNTNLKAVRINRDVRSIANGLRN